MSDDAKPHTPAQNDAKADAKKGGWVKTGVAVGVGSAAVVAALLFANRGTKKK